MMIRKGRVFFLWGPRVSRGGHAGLQVAAIEVPCWQAVCNVM
jgi:hypothetical protein